MTLSATTAKQKGNVQYHINCKPGDLAEYILLVGDPDRVEKIEKKLSSVTFRMQHREYTILTGEYQGVPLSVMATGIGHDNTEIAIIESSQLTKNPTFIRCGTCGALQKDIAVGDLVVSTGSVRIENTTSHFVVDGFPAVAHTDVTMALTMAAQHIQTKFHAGLTASASGFYGAQGREIPGFHVRNKNLISELEKTHVLNMEMETSTLFVLSHLRKARAGAVCAVFANRITDEFGEEGVRLKAEDQCIDVALSAFKFLAQMDQQKTHDNLWVPKLI